MRFLVLGASGMAGHVVSIYLKEQGHDVDGFCRRRLDYVNTIIGDATDTAYLKEVIANGNYDTVINAIGLLNKFAEDDKPVAVFLNGYLPHFLAKITKETKTQIIHMSTDCVFSGKAAPYTEASFRDGESFYDRTKAIGELEDDKNLTLRNSVVGPDMNENGIGLLNWFMKQQGEINGYKGAMWTGLTNLQLAKVMEEAAKKRAHGLVNMVYKDNISKFDLLMLFNKYLRNNTVKINPEKNFCVDKTLLRTNFDFDYTIPDYETMISEMTDWIRLHNYLYPHYNIK